MTEDNKKLLGAIIPFIIFGLFAILLAMFSGASKEVENDIENSFVSRHELVIKNGVMTDSMVTYTGDVVVKTDTIENKYPYTRFIECSDESRRITIIADDGVVHLVECLIDTCDMCEKIIYEHEYYQDSISGEIRFMVEK